MSCKHGVLIEGVGHSKVHGSNRTRCEAVIPDQVTRVDGVTCHPCIAALLTRGVRPGAGRERPVDYSRPRRYGELRS